MQAILICTTCIYLPELSAQSGAVLPYQCAGVPLTRQKGTIGFAMVFHNASASLVSGTVDVVCAYK